MASGTGHLEGTFHTLLPLDVGEVKGEFLDSLAAEHRVVVTLENGILDGGWGERVACYLACTPVRTRTFGIAKGFPDRYDPNELLAQNGMTVENMAAEAVRLLNE